MNHLAQVLPIASPLNYSTAKTGVQFLQNFLTAFLILSFIIGILVFFFVFISGGIDFITSGGDKANTEKAKNKITNSLVGLFILLSLFAFLDLFVLRIFGFNAQSFYIGQLNIGFGNPPPGPTGGAPPGGNCTCQNWNIATNNCSASYVPQCDSSTLCECLANQLCYDPNVSYWRGCAPPSSWSTTCVFPDVLVCDPPTAACSSSLGAGAQCCMCSTASNPLPTHTP